MLTRSLLSLALMAGLLSACGVGGVNIACTHVTVTAEPAWIDEATGEIVFPVSVRKDEDGAPVTDQTVSILAMIQTAAEAPPNGTGTVVAGAELGPDGRGEGRTGMDRLRRAGGSGAPLLPHYRASFGRGIDEPYCAAEAEAPLPADLAGDINREWQERADASARGDDAEVNIACTHVTVTAEPAWIDETTSEIVFPVAVHRDKDDVPVTNQVVTILALSQDGDDSAPLIASRVVAGAELGADGRAEARTSLVAFRRRTAVRQLLPEYRASFGPVIDEPGCVAEAEALLPADLVEDLNPEQERADAG